MLPVLVSLLSLIAYGLIAAFLAFTDYLDWHGRMEVLQEKYPRTAKLVENKPVRLVLLLMVFAMLATNLKETLTQLDAEPFVIKMVAPPTADPGAINPQVAKWKALYESAHGHESINSLRRRTIRLVKELNQFWSRRVSPTQVPVQNPSTDADRQRNAAWDQYWRDAKASYLIEDYRERLVGIVREYKNKGVDTGYMEQGFEQPDRLVGAAPFGGWQLDNCMQYMTELCQLRELAYHVDTHDQPIILLSP